MNQPACSASKSFLFAFFVLLINTHAIYSDSNFTDFDHEYDGAHVGKGRYLRAKTKEEATKFIVGGTSSKSGKRYPYYTNIKVVDEGLEYFACGGTLVNPNYVLTAAHCISPNLTHKLEIGAGVNRKKLDNIEVRMVEPKRIYIHPRYDAQTSEHDVALLYFDEFSKKQPIQLDDGSSNFSSMGKLSVIGMGSSHPDGSSSFPEFLQETSVYYVRKRQCEYAWGHELKFKVCATGYGYSDACLGDSGGPLIDAVEDDPSPSSDILVGVVSYGSVPCNHPINPPVVYARVRSHYKWIKRITKG